VQQSSVSLADLRGREGQGQPLKELLELLTVDVATAVFVGVSEVLLSNKHCAELDVGAAPGDLLVRNVLVDRFARGPFCNSIRSKSGGQRHQPSLSAAGVASGCSASDLFFLCPRLPFRFLALLFRRIFLGATLAFALLPLS
jgi:hypothetical protein